MDISRTYLEHFDVDVFDYSSELVSEFIFKDNYNNLSHVYLGLYEIAISKRNTCIGKSKENTYNIDIDDIKKIKVSRIIEPICLIISILCTICSYVFHPIYLIIAAAFLIKGYSEQIKITFLSNEKPIKINTKRCSESKLFVKQVKIYKNY